MTRFRNKIVLVTGGASGIGRATAERLAQEGADVIIGDINIAGARQAASDIAAAHRTATTAIAYDGSVSESCAALVDQAVAAYGRLDVLCNIAGITDWGLFADFADAAWRRTMDVNLNAAFFITKRAIPHLVASRGNIVNMASAAALAGIPYTTAYCASKAALVAMTKSLAVEYGKAGVRVNAICPSGVRTPMHTANLAAFPEGVDMALISRLAPKLGDGSPCEAEDIAAAVAFLASDEARFITGVALPVDGGQTAG